MRAAGLPCGVATFDLPSNSPEIPGELMQLLRLLALPDGYASQMLQGSKRQDTPHGGFGDPPILSADGVDVWRALADPGDPNLERAAFSLQLRR
uniref:Uncharacterized protein n=1 Tax=Haptolina ericina TaxID=156174 RepID=A0A7S3BRM1_9EUKA